MEYLDKSIREINARRKRPKEKPINRGPLIIAILVVVVGGVLFGFLGFSIWIDYQDENYCHDLGGERREINQQIYPMWTPSGNGQITWTPFYTSDVICFSKDGRILK